MATSLKGKSFQKNLLMSIGGIFLLFAICFSVYQYQREKEYKIDILHSRLQMYNYEMVQTLGEDSLTDSTLFWEYVGRHNVEGLRVSIIAENGRVLLDSYETDVDSLGNHLQRTEIQQALCEGNGYDIKRTSPSTHETYFYSATRFDNIIVRAAVPYSAELTRSLKADNTYIIFSIVLTILLGIALYWSTRRISRHIGYLREFAVKAEEGAELDHELERRLPDDELGDISHTIIQLYWKLRHSEEDKQRIKRQLTQNAAHELKTPAATIEGYLETLVSNPTMPEDKRLNFLERCHAQSRRMSRLLADMSVLSRLDATQEIVNSKLSNCKPIDAASILHQIEKETASQFKTQNIQLQMNIPQTLPMQGDASLIYSLFNNIFSNTLTYATDATYFKVEVRTSAGKYFFTFSDNGPGVPNKHLPHIFERFYRIDKGRSRRLGGTGLGLAIVKNIALQYGGTVEASQTSGGGLTIDVEIKAEPSF